MNEENKSLAIFSVSGIVVGFLSQFIGSAKLALLIAFFIMVVVGKIVGKLFNKDNKWWIKNGAFIFMLLWLVFWIFSFNL